MANQTNNKNQQNDKSVAESIKNADWSAFETVHTNVEKTENANLTDDTNANRANQ